VTDVVVMPSRLSSAELDELAFAARCLDGGGFAARLAERFGRSVEALGRNLPASLRRLGGRAAERALRAALAVALKTIDHGAPAQAARGAHKAAAAASGAIGGAFGPFATAFELPVSTAAFGPFATAFELPVSTAILMRSIAQIAREEGEDTAQPEGALACLEVFALGGEAGETAIEGGYFAVRAALARSVAESARFLAGHSLASDGAPLLARLIAQIAARFGVVAGEKFAAQAVPIVGAIGGAAVNLAFAEHFQSLARGHFIVRRLERRHGAEAVQFEFQRLRGEQTRAA
jgi:hypothetical protein